AEAYYPLTLKPGVELPTPTRRGYVFKGWYDNAAFTGNPITTVTEDTGSDKIYAKWEAAETFEVSFDTLVEDETVVAYPVYRFAGDKLRYLPTPVREGYTFEGWYTDEALTEEFVAGTEITEDITLYAKWEEIYVPKAE